ncbi:hypothetical protein [Staphylococcus xylosus]|uniref:hypothetical protein n=1 Tax=Staphylococcus xylosus TaxID=1288 RepID=UPI003F578340
MIASVIAIIFVVFSSKGIKVPSEDAYIVIGTLITFFSILFSIYGVTLSVIAAMNEKEIFRKLFANNSRSQTILRNSNRWILIFFFTNLLILILSQLLKVYILENDLLINILIFLIPLFSFGSLLLLLDYFRIIIKAMFKSEG